ncbi:hypothetical protein Tco_0552003 [Tanacetum coccineum]
MDDPNITMEEYIRLEKEKSHRQGKCITWKKLSVCTIDMAYSLNENSVFDTGINMAYPGDLRKEIDNVRGVFINLEILKCWSLETSRRLFNTKSC